jgi:hypothetical protein
VGEQGEGWVSVGGGGEREEVEWLVLSDLLRKLSSHANIATMVLDAYQ